MKQILQIDNSLRLVPYCKVNHCEKAFTWYQDVNLVYLVDGVKLPYSQETLEAMYSHLDQHGELFWIEVKEKGFSFPSGHSLAVTLLVGSLIVILSQRIKNPVWRKIVQIVLGLYLVSVLVSRVYLGVHYPSDVLASLCVGLGVLFIEFPFYDKLRFQWRFKGKQK